MPTPNDEQLYLDATQEVDSGTQDPALWAKAMALAEGDQEKARYRYITLRVEVGSQAATTIPPAVISIPHHTYTPQSIRKLWFRWAKIFVGGGALYIIGSIIGSIGYIGVLAPHSYLATTLSGLIIAIAILLLFASTVYSCVLLYLYWAFIQDEKARTSPGKAVGFCFIPVFNVYWFYVALVGLARNINRYCEERHLEGPRVSERLALGSYILLLSVVGFPFLFGPILMASLGGLSSLMASLGGLSSLVAPLVVFAGLALLKKILFILLVVIWLILMGQFCDASISILRLGAANEVKRRQKNAFCVFIHPVYGQKLVPLATATNWVAFFFCPIWHLATKTRHGLWLLLARFALALLGVVITSSLLVLNDEEGPVVASVIFLLFDIAASFIWLFKANTFRHKSLEARGYKLVDIIEARTKDEALAKLKSTS